MNDSVPSPPAPLARGKPSRAGWWIAIVLLAVGLAASALINLGLVAALAARGAGPAGERSSRGQDEFPAFTEIHSFGSGSVKAVRIAIDGLIARQAEGALWGPPLDRVEEWKRQIRAARQDDAVRAILLEVNSPGGVLTPSDELYRALSDFRESREDRVVLVFVRDLAASGAYMAALAGDWIVAEPTSVLGSIGVLIQTLNWKALSDKIGVEDTTIRSDENKDLLNPFDEVDPRHVALFQDIINANHQYFRGLTAERRGLDETELDRLADGRVMTAHRALEGRLIDEIGYWDDALDRLHALLREDEVRVVRYETGPDFFRWLTKALAPLERMGRGSPRLLAEWR
jgi:protease IV